MKTLVIAEKPSVAQDIVRALGRQADKFVKHDDYYEGETYVVTSAVGHLLEITVPEEFEVKRGKWSFAHLPVIPPHFDLKPIDKTKSRLSTIVKLIKRKDIGDLINACDAGREGELIFRLIEQYSLGEKTKKSVRRLWLQSMTQDAIVAGFNALRSDGQMQPLANAARCRAEADWLIGINGTRAMTAFNSLGGGFSLTTVGRVQTPTLSVIVEREEQIRAFKSRDYWEIHATFKIASGDFVAKWFNPKHKKDDNDAELKAERVWHEADAKAIIERVVDKTADVTDESRPSTQLSPLLFDLTSLQREANGRFGFSAKTTLSLAQSLYEKHKALTYPRTDSRYLPQDYLATVKDTFKAIAGGNFMHLAPHASYVLKNDLVKPTKRIFDNTKVSDHFAIIPTLQEPKGLSEAEQKIYDLVARRFMAVFYPAAEFLVTTRVAIVQEQTFKTEGKVLVKSGWLAIYGKEAVSEDTQEDSNLPPLSLGEVANVLEAQLKALKTKPPARYTEATLLSAMEGAGKGVLDEELRVAMQEKGLGTPATRSSIIEGLLNEKYMLRDGRELIPTAKAFQLLTLLRGLGADDLCKAELTGQWEYKLSQMERRELDRASFMAGIAEMTRRMVQKAKEYTGDSVPGNYVTLKTPCPNCGGVVKENYRRFTCCGKDEISEGCGFSFGKNPAGRAFEMEEVEDFLTHKKMGPVAGFRSKAGWPFSAEIALRYDEEVKNYKLEFDFGDSEQLGTKENPANFLNQESVGQCPACGGSVFELGKNYVCEHSVFTGNDKVPSCTFKSALIILQQPVDRDQIGKILATGKSDLLEGFVSPRTKRAFKAMLTWDSQAKKLSFEFEDKPRKARGATGKGTAGGVKSSASATKKVTAKKIVKKKT